MATLKRKSPEPVDAPDVTPTGHPAKKMRLTHNQKQTLMDNLQLESAWGFTPSLINYPRIDSLAVTERARKLRAQYSLQANDLRARIERRVNRIPVSLRKANMGELLEKHTAAAQPQAISPSRKHLPAKAPRNVTNISIDPELSSATRDSRARKTSHEGHYSDKENAPAAGDDGLKNPKRRGKPGPAAGASRVVSQDVRNNDQRILSPKSLNSRTYPHSPFRASPEKGQTSYLSRPVSPVKPSSPLRTAGASGWDSTQGRPRGATTSTVKDNRPPSQAKKTTTRAATGPKTIRSPLPRPATRQNERKNSTGTVSSVASSGTTVLKSSRTGTGATRKATTGTTAATKKPTIPRTQTASLAVKKTANPAATARKTTAPASTTEGAARGTRALRKRV
ncbi:hypothetical protein NUU61_005966 [Penicillium alfredii]|uniref:Borealin N-terminal domain-containing protein n=1 Tax=Penicillium alfredii TaxID=1506179 RepID=A0A9W9K3B0_9EURO|nr:uncharacterized protein NUU61_005966 [Penicillium alfredii]KAJ5091096.1 hypothetical protein NUU61_005966 [Penicillium alfredii]